MIKLIRLLASWHLGNKNYGSLLLQYKYIDAAYQSHCFTSSLLNHQALWHCGARSQPTTHYGWLGRSYTNCLVAAVSWGTGSCVNGGGDAVLLPLHIMFMGTMQLLLLMLVSIRGWGITKNSFREHRLQLTNTSCIF